MAESQTCSPLGPQHQYNFTVAFPIARRRFSHHHQTDRRAHLAHAVAAPKGYVRRILVTSRNAVDARLFPKPPRARESWVVANTSFRSPWFILRDVAAKVILDGSFAFSVVWADCVHAGFPGVWKARWAHVNMDKLSAIR